MLHYNHFFRICKVYDKIYEKKFIKILLALIKNEC